MSADNQRGPLSAMTLQAPRDAGKDEFLTGS